MSCPFRQAGRSYNRITRKRAEDTQAENFEPFLTRNQQRIRHGEQPSLRRHIAIQPSIASPACWNYNLALPLIRTIAAPTTYPSKVEIMKEKKRIPTDGEPVQWKSPFAVLNQITLPPVTTERLSTTHAPATHSAPSKYRGRVDIIRQTAHRGGKTVTVVTGFIGTSQAEKERLAKHIQTACGAGGTVKEGRIEIQGDQRELIARLLTEAGFRPVFAGG